MHFTHCMAHHDEKLLRCLYKYVHGLLVMKKCSNAYLPICQDAKFQKSTDGYTHLASWQETFASRYNSDRWLQVKCV